MGGFIAPAVFRKHTVFRPLFGRSYTLDEPLKGAIGYIFNPVSRGRAAQPCTVLLAQGNPDCGGVRLRALLARQSPV